MSRILLYPLRFEPIYQYRLWGGRRLAGLLTAPLPGDGVFLPAGTVHSLGGGVVVFEVQQNSDVTFRLYHWGHVDAKTGRPRPLQVDRALACIDFAGRAAGPVAPVVEVAAPVSRERLFDCEYFRLWRLRGQSAFPVGAAGVPRVLICLEGAGRVERDGATYTVGKGDVWLLPAVVGACTFQPRGPVNLLEIALPVTE
jgi:mannose-6-phosphate isomerase